MSAPRLSDREPALLAGGAASVVVSASVALLAAFGVLDVRQASAVEAFVLALLTAAPMVAAVWARRRVMPVATVERAGHDPAQVKADAANDAITPFVTLRWRRVSVGMYAATLPSGGQVRIVRRKDVRAWTVYAASGAPCWAAPLVLGSGRTLSEAKDVARLAAARAEA